MSMLFDSFWRAAAYCLRPRVILLSVLPLVLVVALTVGLGYFYWDVAMDQVRLLLESSEFVNNGWAWLDSIGLGRIKTVLAPMVVIFVVTPLIVMVSLLVVALLMTPMLVRLVALRRFPALEERNGASFLYSVAWSLGSTVLALLATVASLPLWFVPPLVLILPPLIWGWLTYRVMSFDALANHASAEERRTVLKRHRMQLLGMGVLTGYLGAAPSLVWAFGALFAVTFFVFLVPLAIWIYTLVFAFSSLWFTHYCLAALQALRQERAAEAVIVAEIPVAEPPLLISVE
ncbi:EI24 domain-containing protein [Candidatus Aalborgicola defluviihabitans]|uniref:EI24 domain-containing protein n=1 Tax=Candidatus Aalborgicola defluviihabitans TaxID=3386187 RepID=UPI001D21F170|nr:EI24 domain-containing protein [Burkholderiales bacterium]